jgi:hypothetical protein
MLAALGLAHEDPKGKAVTVTGTVVDTGCYMSHDAKGEKHTHCATMCAKNGVPLAIVDDSGKLYLPIGANHQNANTKLIPFIEKKVKVTGTAMEKGGLNGIAIKSVTAAQ